MKINLNINEDLTEDSITINAKELTPLIESIMKLCSTNSNSNIIGYTNDDIVLLAPQDILCFYTEKHYVMAKCKKENYRVKGRLYTIEETVDENMFVKISQSCICNINHIKKLKLSFNGLIDIVLSNGEIVSVSKRFVSEIKKRLGV